MINKPDTPYAISKKAAHNYALILRKEGCYICNGILSNHTSPRQSKLYLVPKIVAGTVTGDLNVEIEIGDARDYVKAMWLILQQDKPDDYCITVNQTVNVQEIKNYVIEQITKYKVLYPNLKLFKLGWKPQYRWNDTVYDMIIA